MSFKPIDGTKEEYRMFLARHGVLDALTKVLVKVQDMHPEHPMEFIHSNIAVSLVQQDTITDLEKKLSEANDEVSRLQKEVQRLKQNQPRVPFGFNKNVPK